MNTTRITIVGVLFVAALLSGLWLSHLGKPLNTLVFTMHKLIALGTVTLLGLDFYRLHQTARLDAPGLWAVIASGLLVLALFVSGAFLSGGRPFSLALLTVHRISPLLLSVSSVLGLHLLRIASVP